MKVLLTSSVILLSSMFGLGSCSASDPKNMSAEEKETTNTPNSTMSNLDTATFGAGCFWCVEAVFQQIKGVEKVVSGYSGGNVKNPGYKEVCTGMTGHAEVCQITFDPTVVSYKELLEAFWASHDPTTLNRQGADAGTQYRSVIFYHNDEQKKEAEFYKKQLNETNAYGKPVVTEISSFTVMYSAEDYHQNYYNQNGSEPYCQFVIQPKLEKFKKAFAGKLK